MTDETKGDFLMVLKVALGLGVGFPLFALAVVSPTLIVIYVARAVFGG